MKIGLFCGRGVLPQRVIAACQHRNIPLLAIAFPDQTPEDGVNGVDHLWIRMGAIGEILAQLKKNNVSHVMFAGGVDRPSWSELGLDWTGTKWLAKIGMKSLGDDGLLTAVIDLLAHEGFQVLAINELLPDIICQGGNLSIAEPTSLDITDITYGMQILKTLGPLDVGQAVVVQNGIVLALEAAEGTAAMIARAGALKRPGPGGVLIKCSKPGQSQQADLPSIGPDTIAQIKAAGFCGIAVESKLTQIIDPQTTIAQANAAGIFLVGMEGA